MDLHIQPGSCTLLPMSNPVLLIHGFATSAQRTWVEPGWVDLLADAGREVIAPDLPGHGTGPKSHDPADYADVEAQILAACDGHPVIDAVGYSAGARILMWLAAHHPDRFGRIVLAGMGAHVFETRQDHPILAAIEGRADAEDMVAQHFRSMASSDGNDPAALAAFLRREPPSFTPADAARITAPTLVIIGDADFAGPGEPLADAIAGSTLITLPGVDHFGLPKAFAFVEKGLDFLGAAPF